MKLYPIHALGIRAYCSEVIVDPDALDTIYFLSIAGYQATVKGIIANLLEHYGIEIDIDGQPHYLGRSDVSYRVQVKKLPSGLVHSILFPKLALPKNDEEDPNTFYIFAEENEDITAMFFKHLEEKSDIPMHPSWSRWLWEIFERERWLIELCTLAGMYKGYSFQFNPQQLHDVISQAIRNKETEIIECMCWKGENFDGKPDIT
jgi:hypothetical protein